MFDKMLIANRGEIACRIIRTARALGIRTVAVYSDADAASLHVMEADEAVAIGGSAPAESYLHIEKIVDACLATGAQAVHPGYGFLSERHVFAEALEGAGIVFIGPDGRAIAAMGDKIESKKLAAAAGVTTVPGYLGVISNPAEATTVANDIGYPVMVKATAGGGGKGMRLVHDDADLVDALRAASSEARSAFGDERVFIEKAILKPRHIEIQVLGDAYGNVVFLGERECSIQRRHQKVIEEAPSPFLDEATRQAMGRQAVSLAKAVGYRSAGTVEFIVDQDRNFFFLEMNTRLQVEHPVTEAVTGLDLVELMIRIAAGERLPMTQDQITLTGSAIEARVYAEDPLNGFLPSIGRLTHYRPPVGDGIRVDTGVYEGAEISIYYDPMIAKLVTYGPTRDDASRRMADALDRFVIRGVNHNIGFLAAIVRSPRFLGGDLSTDFIGAEFPGGFHGAALSAEALDRLVIVAAAVHQRVSARERPSHAGGADWAVLIGPTPPTVRFVTVTEADDHGATVTLDEKTQRVVTSWQPGALLWEGTVDSTTIAVQLDRRGTMWRLRWAGAILETSVVTRGTAALVALMPAKVQADVSKVVRSPMPGLLVSVTVNEGQAVKAGDLIAIVEAMKMENVVRAERNGTVTKIMARPGESVAADQVIVEFG
jgi:propionyl-CoA carboxylase alpha chain